MSVDFGEGTPTRTASLVERLLFDNRKLILALCAVVTAFLGHQAFSIRLSADFEKMIPIQHPYIQTYLAHKSDMEGMGNALRVAVEAKGGSIIDADYLDTLKRINDDIFYIPGVNRPFMKSLWTPNARWLAETEEGMEGGVVIPDGYDGSAESLAQVRVNLERSGEVGQLVAADFNSSVIYVPLLDRNPLDGRPLDYKAISLQLEEVRARYQAEGRVNIAITGFAKIIGDMLEGMGAVMTFFGVSTVLAAAMVYWYTRCLRSTLLVVACSLIAVIWQLGLLPLLGYGLDPYSVLVPFLIFAIGMSHGAQKMNGIMQDIGRGVSKLDAARFTFRRLFLAGLTALLCDAVSFAVLAVIEIPAIHELALAACIGVLALIFTNLILLPILLSFTGVDEVAAIRSLRDELSEQEGRAKHPVWRFLDLFTKRRWAIGAVVAAAALGAVGFLVSTKLKIGDLDAGAPELRIDSRYNRDNAFMTAHYAASSDVLVVFAETGSGKCTEYGILDKVDALEWRLRQLPGVESTTSFAGIARRMAAGMNEGSPKWYELPRTQGLLNAISNRSPRELFNQSCDLLSVHAYLRDHKADTLTEVVREVEAFASKNNGEDVRFRLGAGNAGIDAATNIVVKQASNEMLLWVYGTVIILCFITFRNWGAVVCAVLPLMLTTALGEALMVALGMGVKVSTLPVIALGVGIGVDYALYVVTVMLARLRKGASLSEAYYQALMFTGKVVMLTGFTLAVGVGTWALSPIKFQADMGVLLGFMFLWNMLGALVLLPALGYFFLRTRPSEQ